MDNESKEMFQKLFDKIDKIDNRLDVIELKQNKMSDQLTELQLSQKLLS